MQAVPKRGRPPAITKAEISRRALVLFAEHGFEATTVDEIAAACDISRRTLFRYFASKNDVVWGDFDAVLERLRREFAAVPAGESLLAALARSVVESNRYEPDALPELRERMTLITTVPALQAHSLAAYAAWRGVVAEFVAARLGQRPDDLLPLTIGYVALAASMAAFVRWVENPADDLGDNLRAAYDLLASGFATLR